MGCHFLLQSISLTQGSNSGLPHCKETLYRLSHQGSPHSFPHSYGLPHSSVGKKSTCNAGDPGLIPGLERSAREAIGYSLQYSWAFLVAQLVKESACNVGDLGSIPGLGRSPGEGKGYPLQYSGLENSMGLQRVGKTEWLSFTLYIKILLNIKLKLWGQLKPAL